MILVAAFIRGVPAAQGGLPGSGPTDQPTADGGRPNPTSRNPGATPGPTNASSTPSPAPTIAFPFVPIENGGTLSVTPGAITDFANGHFPARPGQMSVDHQELPAPWTGGTATTVDVHLLLPPGYDPQHQRYPTVYVTPNPYQVWLNRFGPQSAVASLTAAGDLPPMIYVFAPAIGGPYRVTQCIDSSDGLQRWDTFMSTTLVQWVDSHYATIAAPAARTIMGSSQGGYCAADLLLRHPDVWHQGIAFSGFYDAAPRNPETAGNSQVYGNSQALMDAYSPVTIAPGLPAATRLHLFMVLAGLSSQAFFGPQMDQFAGILDGAGYARAVIEAPYGHSPKTVEQFMPRALRLIAARMVQEGTLP